MHINLTLRIMRKFDKFLFGLRRRLWLARAVRQSRISCGCLVMHEIPLLDCPIRCDGCGKVQLAGGIRVGYRKAPRIGSGEVLLQARRSESLISIGSKSAFSNNVSVIANTSVAIGKNCLIGDMVSIFDSDFHDIDPVKRHESGGKSQPVVIGNNVLLGSRVLVLKGVTIGDNSVVAAGAVVTKSIPANVIAGGVPAVVIRRLDAV